ncbi:MULTISPECIES: hypothetical protein [unclassified Vibrio]|uniref:hypothetical protein n=1 Tax=unclassified Vibrio TaxID=2614977 RepID=UPI001268C352|nr:MULTISPECIES: hypothetical protein [unclassified Vibrio]QFT40118.1 hypothetical protein FIU99_27380 [Vibrio sp. THAF64]QGM37941.1 hypothetical protein GGC04_26975 [Vibrio sp. THAF191d]QGN73478.1 hypothetical protein GGC03_27195 [Vibrio sp. THAF191c]
MQIPAFPLPSNMTKTVNFRVPTVEDGMMFCELDESNEEASTTQFLNHLQDGAKGDFSDSGAWTGEDRRTALWWIFMSTSELGTIPFSYDCSHCGKTHYLDLHMAELMETAKAVPSLPKTEIEFTVKGQPHKATVQPMNGYAAEHIEGLRNTRDQFEPESGDWKKAANEMALNELAHCLTFNGQPEDTNEALDWKLELIKSMHLRTEFVKVSALVEQALREARHGLLTKYHEGRYYLVTTIPECDEYVKKGGPAARTLLLPFRNLDFITTF